MLLAVWVMQLVALAWRLEWVDWLAAEEPLPGRSVEEQELRRRAASPRLRQWHRRQQVTGETLA